MLSPIQRIYDFNRDAGLLDRGYSDFLEPAFQLEEAMEGFDLQPIADQLELSSSSPRDVSRDIMSLLTARHPDISDVDRLDKACDAIVFAVGSIAKLGLTPDKIEQALHIVMDANSAKLGCPKDAYGKLTKPADFPNPEPRLLAILDTRN